MTSGFAMVAVLFVMLVILILGLAIGSTGIRQTDQIFRTRQSFAAIEAARAGIIQVTTAFQTQPAANDKCASVTFGSALADGASFTATATSGVTYAGGRIQNCLSNVAAPDGTSVHPGYLYIVSRGTQGSARQSTVAWYTVKSGWPFPYALFAGGPFLFGGRILRNGSGTVTTDSYNSSGGASTHIGNVGVSSMMYYFIDLYGVGTFPYQINGSVFVGPGGNNPALTSAGANTFSPPIPPNQVVTGSVSQLPALMSMPVIVDPNGGAGATNVDVNTAGETPVAPGQYDQITIESGAASFACGGIYSVNTLSISNIGQINVGSGAAGCPANNPIKIYVYNTLLILGNGIQDATISPRGMLIFTLPGVGVTQLYVQAPSSFALYGSGLIRHDMGFDNPPVADQVINGSLVGSWLYIDPAYNENYTYNYDEALNNDPYTGLIILTPVERYSK